MTNERRQPPRTLSIGGAAYDIFVSVDPAIENNNLILPVGGKISVRKVEETCGGGSANTSVGLARLGCSARFCAVVGNDQWGERMMETLKRENVNTEFSTIVEEENTGFSIILLLPSGERTILHHAGTNEHLHDVTFPMHGITDTDAVYLNRLSESACEIENDVIRILKDEVKKTHLTWNPGGCQIESGMKEKDKAALLQYTDLLLLNKEEATIFTGEKEIAGAMHALIAAGVKNVCITDGKEGAYATDGKKLWHCAAREGIAIVDTTGAGDAFGSAMTWSILRGETLPNSLKAGTLNAASVVSAIGAQTGLLTEEQLLTELHDHPLQVNELPF